MSVCRRARQKVLEFVTTLSLSCPNPADGKISEYMIPFDCEETCFCIQGWQELPGPRKAIHNTKGLDFARKIKRLAFVAKDYDVRERPLGPEHELRDCISEEVREDLETFFLLFHNAVQIAGISISALGAREILGEEDFLSLFLFQPIMQKMMVDGFPITIPYFDRFRMIYHAWHAAFVNLDSRVRAALSPDRMRS
ncbi:hypothetical protein N8I77_010805 [Diaporthe amygdali]|uniref:Uncharacterized protein n=1 Tax=Phomopsis amygdali TaxID=1214568 RepID=A0AAD9S7V1_PHOAM|nr:hypothetical protein N8I77_010805 [Diaporthe amygdali]